MKCYRNSGIFRKISKVKLASLLNLYLYSIYKLTIDILENYLNFKSLRKLIANKSSPII